MSEYNITIVPAGVIELIWDRVVPLIQDVVAKAPDDIDIDTLYLNLMEENHYLLTVSKGPELIAVATVTLRVLESGVRALYIPVVSGKEMEFWKDDFLKLAEALGKDYACSELRGMAARKGWLPKLKPYGWEEVFTTVRYKFGED